MAETATGIDHAQRTDGDEILVDPRDPVSHGFIADHHLDKLEHWLDDRFRLPIIGTRIGMDGIIGLIPGVGDVITTGMSAVFIADAWKAGARKSVLARMAGNMAIDFVVGAVPLVGDLFDFMFKSNRANLRLLRDEKLRLAQSAGTGALLSSDKAASRRDETFAQ